MSEKKYRLSLYEIIFCFCCFVFYFLWAINNKPLDYSPDEHMRYNVSEFLFKNNRLPLGAEIKDSVWGFSYACLPTMFRHVIDFIFMKIGSVFFLKEFHILLCARMVSVLCGTLVVLFTIKISKILFDSPSRWLMVGMVAFIPQFAFLSSYINNDIVALLGVTLIMYSWALGINYNWNFKSSLILAIGVAICAASYYNSYAWILFSVFLFIFTYLNINKKDYKGLFKHISFISLVVFLIAGYFFIRHLFYYRDLLGIKTTRLYGELYALESFKPSNRVTCHTRGVSLISMLFEEMHFVELSYKSFIGCFGCMQYQLPQFIYDFYSTLFIISLVGIMCHFIYNIRFKSQSGKNINIIMFQISLMFCIIITIGLSIYNSYFVDFQAQGRYCYPALPAIAYFFTKGFDFILKLLFKANDKYQYAIVGGVFAVLAFISLEMYNCVYLQS